MSDLDFLNDTIAKVPCPRCTGKNECDEHCSESIASHCLHSPLPSGHVCFLKCAFNSSIAHNEFFYFCFKRQLGATRYSYKIQELDGFNPETVTTNMNVREKDDIIFKNWESQLTMALYDFNDMYYIL